MLNACFFSSSAGTILSGVVTPTRCRLRKGLATNGSAAVRYLQIFEQRTAPVEGDVPKISIPIDPGGGGVDGREYLAAWLPDEGLAFEGGLAWAVSSARGVLLQAGVLPEQHSVVVVGGNV